MTAMTGHDDRVGLDLRLRAASERLNPCRTRHSLTPTRLRLIVPGMEALAEQIVATYLTRGGKVFVVPQYAIPAPKGKGDWACPDFVALDFEAGEVVVVEVATGARFAGLLGRVAERETRWFAPIRAKLARDGLIVQAGWRIRFLGFVREACLDEARRPFAEEGDVAFTAIEDATFPWTYWNDRDAKGLPC